MIQTILMVIATLLVVLGTISFISKLTAAAINKAKVVLIAEIIAITIGLSYLIWYCN